MNSAFAPISVSLLALVMAGCSAISSKTPYDETQPAIAVPLISASTQPISSLSAMSLGVETDRGLMFTLESVFFDVDKATLRSEAQQRLNEIVSDLMSYSNARLIVVEGHADSTGATAYNQSLSESRALTVKNALISRGIAASRITTQGFGELQPAATNSTSAGRQLNRRVEITLLNDGTGTASTTVLQNNAVTTTTVVPYNPSLELR